MPLSEQERRALEELEAQLSAEDPKFASTMVSDPNRARRRRRVLLGVLALAAGLALVVLAVTTRQTWLGAIGFLGMVFGVTYAVGTDADQRPDLHVVGSSSAQRAGGSGGAGRSFPSVQGGFPGSGKAKAKPARGASNSGFMQRLEERWDRRRRENQGW